MFFGKLIIDTRAREFMSPAAYWRRRNQGEVLGLNFQGELELEETAVMERWTTELEEPVPSVVTPPPPQTLTITIRIYDPGPEIIKGLTAAGVTIERRDLVWDERAGAPREPVAGEAPAEIPEVLTLPNGDRLIKVPQGYLDNMYRAVSYNPAYKLEEVIPLGQAQRSVYRKDRTVVTVTDNAAGRVVRVSIDDHDNGGITRTYEQKTD